MSKVSCLWILLFSTSIVKAECTPTPDCGTIGYTETACDGDFVRCPFDISKLLCLPCDNDYKYECNGTGYNGGVGTACGNKYTSCNCATSYTWYAKTGICRQNCTIGMIYYSDGNCSTDLDNTKTPIGVVIKNNKYVLSQKRSSKMAWASNTTTNVSGITETTNSEVAKTDYAGLDNTLAIVESFSGDTISNNAAVYCNSYSTEGTNVGDWYLPAAGELYNYVYGNYYTIYSTMRTLGWTFDAGYFWSSSEHSAGSGWGVYVSNGNMDYSNLYNDSYSVSCFLAI